MNENSDEETEMALQVLPTCLWNMAGAVEPRLYSNRNDIGVVTECWRSLTWHKIFFMYT